MPLRDPDSTVDASAHGLVHPRVAGANASGHSPAGPPDDGPASEVAPTLKLNPLESAERNALLQELGRRDWNLSSVARELHMSRNTLYRKLQRLNIKPPDKSLFH
jgi:transcriptional regulator of acetoin/glycerol metabolism